MSVTRVFDWTVQAGTRVGRLRPPSSIDPASSCFVGAPTIVGLLGFDCLLFCIALWVTLQQIWVNTTAIRLGWGHTLRNLFLS